jgi:hypothetical protein
MPKSASVLVFEMAKTYWMDLQGLAVLHLALPPQKTGPMLSLKVGHGP